LTVSNTYDIALAYMPFLVRINNFLRFCNTYIFVLLKKKLSHFCLCINFDEDIDNFFGNLKRFQLNHYLCSILTIMSGSTKDLYTFPTDICGIYHYFCLCYWTLTKVKPCKMFP
jgi:hypothetical protein